ncbi:hypothetical protein CR513_58639, partial [Mucuna pruriens]
MDNGEGESDISSDNEMSPLEDCSDVDVGKLVDRVVHITRRVLSIHPKEDDDVEQREHIFHTRCHINDKSGYNQSRMKESDEWKTSFKTKYVDEFDLRTNPFEEGGNDRDQTNKAKDPLYDTEGPMTRSKTKMMK